MAAVFCAAVGGDIVFHVAVGQAVVVLLLGVLADVPLHNRIQGIVLPHLLEMSIFWAHGIGGELGKGLVHDDGTIVVVETKRVLHCYVPPV